MDPLALVPYALAAAGGRVGPHDVTALVAAGVTLLQRSAPLVRALTGRRSAILLPPGPAWVVALAASDGRGAVLIDVADDTPVTEALLATHRIGAVFTMQSAAHRVPASTVRVLLDESPYRATVLADAREIQIDLGSHFGLDLEGDAQGPGSPEECLLIAATGESRTHADVLAQGRETMARDQYTPVDRTLALVPLHDPRAFIAALVAPLLAGGMVHLHAPVPAAQATDLFAAIAPTMIVAVPEILEPLVTHADADPHRARPVKRVAVHTGSTKER
jgi:acyl-CoA synthetase (AMP-forming)/AMP-acid ligase II